MLAQHQILELSEPVEQMYMDCSSQLIINIASHFKTGKGLETRDWQIRKLSELGQLTKESAEIIAANTGQSAGVITAALEKAVGMSLTDVEKNLQAAAKAGKIAAASGDIFASERVKNVLQNYVEQAANDFNLVNTVMLDSTLNRYRAAIAGVVNYEETAKIEKLMSVKNAPELEKQLKNAQRVLNQAAGSVNLATATRQQALRQAVKDLADRGITGFVDRAGHHWTPEAYVNMDVRTTVHNTSLQAQKARSADYGVDTFQVSTKAAARPRCAPYQGWICSWGNWSGTVKDLHGREYTVHPINATSYGEAAGLFGINCGHTANTFIPNYSLARDAPLNEKQQRQNAIEYQQSQQQRQIEREIRKAKTEAIAYDAAGDKVAFDAAALKVKDKNAQYKAFCQETGRTQRLDRTQVIGYNKNISAKSNASVKSQKQQYAAAHNKPAAQQNGTALNFKNRRDADNVLRPQTEALWPKLTQAEREGAYQYTVSSGKFNRPLRGYDKTWDHFKGVGQVPLDNEGGAQYINGLTSAIDKSALKQDIWLYRGSDQQSLAGLLGIDKSKIVPSNVAALNRKFSGKPIRDQAFFSTGIAADAGFSDKIAYEILALKGTKGIYAEPFSYYGGTNTAGTWNGKQKSHVVGSEAEMILQRGTWFKVLEIKNVANKVTVVLEVLP